MGKWVLISEGAYKEAKMGIHMTICNDSDYFFRHRLFLPEELCERGHQAIAITGGKRIVEPNKYKISFHHVEIERFAFSPLKDLKVIWEIGAHIVRSRPDSLHLVTLKPAIYGGISALVTKAIFGRPTKVLVTIPGLGRLLTPQAKSGTIKFRAAKQLSLFVLRILGHRSFVHFTFETEHDRNALAEQRVVDQHNSTVIAGAGVDGEIYTPFQRNGGIERTRVLFASRLLKSKGIEAFLQAAEMNTRKSEIEYVVAGIEDPLDPDAFHAEQIKNIDYVSYLGEETDMVSLLKKVDIVCLPSLYGEGIPRILIEAAACGLPTISTQHPGCMQITRHLDTGVVIPMSDIRTMAIEVKKAVEMYTDNSFVRAEHGLNARQLFEAGGFSKRSVTQKFLSLLGVD